MWCCCKLPNRKGLISKLWVLSWGTEEGKRSPRTNTGRGMWLLLASPVSNRNQDHPFCHGNLAGFTYRCWGLSVSRSNGQIKFKLSAGRRRSCTRPISFRVDVQQPARACSCIRSSPMRVCETAETKSCCSRTPAWPPAGTTHALHTLPCFSSQLCESCISQGCRPPLFLRRDGALAWPYPSRESPHEGGLFFNAVWDGFQLSETWQGAGAIIIFISFQAGGWTAWPALFSFWSQGNLKNLKHISGCLNYFPSIQTGKSLERKPECNTCKLKGHQVTCNATLVPGRPIWDGDNPMPEFCLVSQRSHKEWQLSQPCRVLVCAGADNLPSLLLRLKKS